MTALGTAAVATVAVALISVAASAAAPATPGPHHERSAGRNDARRLATSRSRFNALPAACQRPGGDRAGTCFRAAACRQPAHAGAAALLRRARSHAVTGQFCRAMGRPGRQASARGSPRRTAAGIHSAHISGTAVHGVTGSRRLRAGGGIQPGISGRDAMPRAARPGWHTVTAWSAQDEATKPESGNGTELYVVTGHAPRQLDRNIALVGRVVKGIELLSVLPRGTGPLGFYEKPEQYVPITSVRLAADVPAPERETCRCCAPTRPVSPRSSRRAAIAGMTGILFLPVISTCATCRWWSDRVLEPTRSATDAGQGERWNESG